jgi:D-amino-acid dehydrogenase
VVVGAGAVGVAAAYYLTLDGWQVTVVDRGEVGGGCSYANACLIVPSHAAPLAGPGVLSQVARWVGRPDSPVYVRPRLSRGLLDWGTRFVRACRDDAHHRGTQALRTLARWSLELFDALPEPIQQAFGYRRSGLLDVWLTADGFRHADAEADQLQRAGFRVQVLSSRQARDREPALGPRVAGALFVADDAHGDCHAYVQAVARAATERGARVLTGTTVGEIATGGGGVRGVVTSPGGVLSADVVVLAAGAWTPALLAPLGVRLPMEPAKGYSVTFPDVRSAPSVPVYVMERRVAITPLPGRLRVGGTLELAGFHEGIHTRRYAAVLAAAQQALGQPLPPGGQAWAGFRPLTADSLPVISQVPGISGLFVAAGHGTLGFTLSPASGRAVADLAAGRPSGIPLEPFRIDRF